MPQARPCAEPIPSYLLPSLELGVLTALPGESFLLAPCTILGRQFPSALRPVAGNISPLHGI